ncbi:Y-family DNA polymerase [Limoniibacter endophyticus]|uniref:Nucleotidyltransferase n=1 Tax=Limoniibacter endophyticus TaxID=1565040 RepID=A0A8J3DFV9_9HYPH|nr:DNA polymerase Y family protein [Limoniibacter endophyticus]GHC62511.1 nucleotidyltransferase [Limoniibacter endophyticus]
MTRVVSIYFPDLATDRIRRLDPSIGAEKPVVVLMKSGSKRFVSAADKAARRAGVRIGMQAAKVQAVFRDLLIFDEDNDADQKVLEQIALWALRQYSPLVAVDVPDGIVLDTEGADHLHGGEQAMLDAIFQCFQAKGLTARVAIADTWGAAHACARVIRRPTVIVPRGQNARAVENLPIAGLRLPEHVVRDFRTFGFRTIGEISRLPRGPLVLRFGVEVGRRLDQMFGQIAEPIIPIRATEQIEVTRLFAEPIGAAETIDKYVARLTVQLVEALQQKGLGVRKADLVVEQVDGTRKALRIGTAKPTRDIAWLTRLLRDRREKIDPGAGIERLSLVASVAESLLEEQKSSSLVADDDMDIVPLMDIYANRGQRVYRVLPYASDIPERSVRRVAFNETAPELSWTQLWPRPVRLLTRPEAVEVIALLPDHPPVSVTWRGKRRRIKRADGPERIFGEWWHRDAEYDLVRDYFVVEEDEGARFWIFRTGDGVDAQTGSQEWFLHGVFA